MTHYQDLLALTRRRSAYLEQRIASHQIMIGLYESWVQQIQASYRLDPLRIRFLERYQVQLDYHQARLRMAQFQYTLAAKRLSRLSALIGLSLVTDD